MLMLTRRQGESLLIGDDVQIFITKIDEGRVQIGIKAPPSIRVLRQELADGDLREGVDGRSFSGKPARGNRSGAA